MPSTYTLNNGIELIATGEQSGTWGDTTNTNMSLLDTALDGQVTVTLASAGNSGSPNTLPISDGSASDGRNRMVIFNDGADLGATAYVQLTPNDAEKIVYIRNALSGSRSIIVFQGTYNASNDYEIPAGTTAVVYFNGGGTGAVAANVFNNASFDALNIVGAAAVGTTLTVGTSLNIASSTTVDGVLDEDNMASDSATKLATQQSIKAYVDSQVTAQDLDFAGDSGTGAVDLDSQTFTVAGTANEIETSASGQTLTVGLPGNVTITTSLTTPTVKASNIDANDGTAAINIADSTGAVDIDTSLNVDGLIEGDQLRVGGTLGNFDVSSGGNQVTFDYNGFNYINSTGAGSALVVRMGSGSTNAIRFDSDGKVIVNDDGNDTDFRVESDTNTHALFVDAGNSRVGVFNSSPATALDVTGTVTVSGTDAGTGGVFVETQTAGVGARLDTIDATTSNGATLTNSLLLDSDNHTIIRIDSNNNGSGDLYITESSSDTARFRIANNGDITFFEDTGTTEKLLWDASSERLTLKTSGAYALDVQASGTTSVTMAQFSNSAGSDKAYIALDSTGAGKLVLLDGGNNEDVLIAANSHSYYNTGGNFYFGKTSGDLSTDGVEARAVGLLGATRTSNPPLFLRRNTDDGTIISLSKDATEIGTLGSNSGGLFIADDDTGLFFNRASNNILPYRNDSGNEGPYTNALDLGRSTARFKDAYLRSVDITNDSDRGRIRLYANASLGGEMRIFNANGYGLISMIENHTLNFHTNNEERLELGSGVAVFNDISADVDFRVESNNKSAMFFVDAGNDRIGIGTNAPERELEISLPTTTTTLGEKGGIQFKADSSTAGNGGEITWQAGTGDTERWCAISGHITSNNATGSKGDLLFAIKPNDSDTTLTEALRIKADGTVVVNEQSNDQDFRVESDNLSSALFVNGANGNVTLQGATTTIGSNAASTNVEFNLNGVASKAQRIQFQESGTNRWLLGQGAASETSAFELYNAGGVIALSVDRTSNIATFQRGAVFNEGSADSDFRVESNSNSHALFVDAGNDRVQVTGQFTVDESSSGITPYRTYQVITGEATAAASNTYLDIVDVGVTSALTARVIAVESTSLVGVWVGGIASAYGGAANGITSENYTGGTITDIDVRYNNTASTIQVRVTYTGATPTLYWSIDGMSNQSIYNLV